MSWRSVFFGRASQGSALVLLLVGVLGGCATSRSPEATAEARASVVGVWEYRTNGTSVLQRGTLRISVVNGHLMGRLRDSWQGDIRARVRLHGNQMALDLNGFQITGRVRQGEFEASIRRTFDEMSVQPPRRGPPARFFARRVRSTAAPDSEFQYGCRSLLREHSYQCSPFQREE
jgi:hypothetical protein